MTQVEALEVTVRNFRNAADAIQAQLDKEQVYRSSLERILRLADNLLHMRSEGGFVFGDGTEYEIRQIAESARAALGQLENTERSQK